MKFRVELTYDFEYHGYVAECSTLPGCISQGKTKDSALHNIREAIRGWLRVAKEKGVHIPADPVQECFVSIPASAL
ncbi:type II toxin-antitoxin system HicB family antitoxin [bacterium]|nr:type II toxin-antitoxin system HicB family antitoxin [bacterium]MBU3955562.1 type II toxin-antitoxin system HicB family antitoxin [bacterium]